MTEEKVWKTTPRKLFLLWDMHKTFNGWGEKKKKKEKRAFIDQILF